MYEKTKLFYNLDDFEPYLGYPNLDIHYNYLYDRYIQKLNQIFTENNFEFVPIEQVLVNYRSYPREFQEDIINNAGGYYNHTLFFNSIMPPDYMQTMNYTELDALIDKQFGNKENFTQKLRESMLSIFGSGYTFVIYDDGKLKIVTMQNQDNPLLHNKQPIFALDMWEHSYYLDYPIHKENYVDLIVNNLNYNYGDYLLRIAKSTE